MSIKQVIVVRRDLEMPPGKLAAQVAHASVLSFKLAEDYVIKAWEDSGSTKIVLGVDTLEDLEMVINELYSEHTIPKSLVVDEGRTVFDGVETITCLGIGPMESDLIDKFTGKLELY